MTSPFHPLKPLWLIFTGGAFVSLAGGALTLMYFWSLGGVPIGQASSAGDLAKIVLPTALFIAAIFLAIWLAPTMMSSAFIDESEFTQVLRRLFTNPAPISKQIDSEKAHPQASHSADHPKTQLALVADHSNATVADPQFETENPSVELNLRHILLFALVTMCSGFFALVLLAYGVQDEEGTLSALAIWLGIPMVFTGLALAGLWWYFNSRVDRKEEDASGSRSVRRNKREFGEWLAFGYITAIVAIVPLISMLLAFLRSDAILEDNTIKTFLPGAVLILLAITLSYTVSLALLVRRTRGAPVQWGTLFAINAAALFFVVLTLGLTSRVLEAVMVMASVRVENAVMTLEPEGCELLESMQASGWGRTPGTESKTCTLYGITIQSTLEPSMQIACWRGVLDTKQRIKKRKDSATEVAHIPAGAIDANTRVKTSSLQVSPTGSTNVTGSRGAFYMPVKYVRSVWKTGGIEAATKQDSVCPTTLYVGNAPAQPNVVSGNAVGAK